jgi:4-amino-4-deoxy-L-arabinose transferase-like glycosyltransferase
MRPSRPFRSCLMSRRLLHWLPEAGLAALLLFFAVRELGTFPASWADEGLFIIVAKMIAFGHGYALPLLHQTWHYPYFLNVGPMLILPAALSIKLFGLSVTAARIPMAGYLLLSTACFYFLTLRLQGRDAARWATLLLITLSAFINTGKTVIGEVPAFAFTLIGFLLLLERPLWKRGFGAGVTFGLAVMTKITFGLLLPSLGIAWIAALVRKQWTELKSLTVTILAALAVFLPWRITEMSHTVAGSLWAEIHNEILGGGEKSVLFYVLRVTPDLLLRLPYLAFDVLLVFAVAGLWKARKTIDRTLLITYVSLLALFILYFLTGYGWYRFLLPAHLLLLPFVPAGARSLLGRRAGVAALIAIAALQGYWQWDHRGSSASPEGEQAAAFVLTHYQDKDLIIGQTEVFARLPENPHWLFLMPPISFSLPREYTSVDGTLCGMPVLMKLNPQQEAYFAGHLEQAAGRYAVIHPPYDCPLRFP